LQAVKRRYNLSIEKSLKVIEEQESELRPRLNADGDEMSMTTDILNLVRAKTMLIEQGMKINGDTSAAAKNDATTPIAIPFPTNPVKFMQQKRVTNKDADGKITGTREEQVLTHAAE